MDVSAATWLSALEMEDYDLNNPHQMKYPFNEAVAALSSQSFTDYPYVFPMNQSFPTAPATSCIERSLPKQPKSEAISNNRRTNAFAPSLVSSSNTFIMSFGNPSSPPEMNRHHLYDESILKNSSNPNVRPKTDDFSGSVDGAKRVPGTNRNETKAQDHVLAERKRREILTGRFIALSALLPNLKKMDKATVLEDATKYIKQLQTRMKELEEETNSKSERYKQESAVSIRRSKISGYSSDGAPSYRDEDETDSSNSPDGDICNPEIEVRISERSVLVRIYSKKNSTVAMKTFSEMERLHLTISSSSVIPFSSSALLITITAQMSEECVLTTIDVVKSLQSAIRSYI